ncbi:phospholipid/glycerol acyltransferase [Beutenbergia cavernae DSM 12333]|uniref:Phospholipid/glycerol acyltransferase n=1 Tax=Beutenbergia cavernae (strain ATCC BAA-8 / DSM 12333 / CCUG 43141 / JCM 11478 / NBRC 16432 / NCIMB 13614 / HKI 0122) TaxID=471853 RepID=C5C6J5_BEUC1|nr:lysophospholipid acyltransferase family protein [Beutenbergia cavernae]ACQ80401.1 phospholipid/glycerol acyltransferase [Beutenbergia cavernae DSM 12333]
MTGPGQRATPPGPGRGVTPEDIRRWGPTWSRRVGWFLDHVWWSTSVLDADRVPPTGRVLLAPNHTGVVDGPVVHGAVPRESHFLVKEEFFTSRLGFLMRWAGQIPVDRTNGRAALTTALALLEEDRCVGVFPEGTRGRGDVTTARHGIAWLAVRSGAPVVPVAVLGTRRSGDSRGHVPGPRSRLYVAFGEPVQAAEPGATTGRRAIAGAMDVIRGAMLATIADATARTGVGLPADDPVAGEARGAEGSPGTRE